MADEFSRRFFLKSLGGASLALPFLPSIGKMNADWAIVNGLSSVAMAAEESEISRRFVAIWTPFGQYKINYWPKIDAQTVLETNIREHALAAIPGGPSNVINANRFSGLYSKMLLIRGLDCTEYWGHNFNIMLGAGRQSATEVTIDNVMAQSPLVYPTEPIIRALHLRPSWNDGMGGQFGISFGKIGDRISMLPNYSSAAQAFRRVFGHLGEKNGKRTKIVDQVFESFKNLHANPRLGSDDRQEVENYMTRLSELEQRLVSEEKMSCQFPKLTPEPGADSLATMDWDIAIKNHIDVLVAALTCGATKIGTLLLSGENPFFNSYYHHMTLAHNNDQTNPTLAAQSVKVNDWYAKWVSYLLNEMDKVHESNGKTMLDNSVVYWGNENSTGSNHSIRCMPVMLAGSCGGYFKTGRYIDYRNQDTPVWPFPDNEKSGRLYNQLLVTLLQAMKFTPRHYEQSDKPGFGSYYLFGAPETNACYAPFLSKTEKRKPLPFISAS